MPGVGTDQQHSTIHSSIIGYRLCTDNGLYY